MAHPVLTKLSTAKPRCSHASAEIHSPPFLLVRNGGGPIR